MSFPWEKRTWFTAHAGTLGFLSAFTREAASFSPAAFKRVASASRAAVNSASGNA